jgi:ABC-2 type transport system ATP-binding protein
MIEVEGLTKVYVDLPVVDDLNFFIPEGQVVGFLGPNGAGKTTAMRMITAFLPPTAGRIVVAGVDLDHDPVGLRRNVGYLPENVPLYPEMRVDEYLRFRADVEEIPRGDVRLRMDDVMDRCMVGDVRRQVIGTLSKGYRQRVGLAGALIHQPQVLILDEPTVGLDPNQIIKVRELITELGADHTVILSTHILPEVEQVCERVFIIDHGRIVADGTPEALRTPNSGAPTVMPTMPSFRCPVSPMSATRATAASGSSTRPTAILARRFSGSRWTGDGPSPRWSLRRPRSRMSSSGSRPARNPRRSL